MKKIISFFILCSLMIYLFIPFISTAAGVKNSAEETTDEAVEAATTVDTGLELASPSAVLIEGSTGQIIYEKDKDEQLKPASVTKVMTLLLIFEALDSGQIKLTDEVSVSEHAASMGGSQVFLEPFETQNVDTMIKCISVASANDASVAMAEYIAGSEEEFVARMNERAKELGMVNTNFKNCCGLDTDGHYTSAYDIALMSRELITKHPQISNYATIWMDTFVHTTRKGKTEFGLANTNKLVRTYNGITGLKTGSTSLAKYCLSASARRNNMDLIAVILAAPDPKTRFQEAAKLLNYGFANCSVYQDENIDTVLDPVKVNKGVEDTILGKVNGTFSYVCFKGKSPDNIRKEVKLVDEISAPIAQGDKVGEVTYFYDNEKIGTVDIVATQNINKAGFKDYLNKVLKKFFLSK
ncbi:MAG: hypothetical protein K0S47_1774 [Herbinix sp.]|nr:hypothetical protein [Herbinix sp.]